LLRGRVPEEELGEQRLTVARALIQSQKYSHEQIMHFLYFLKNFIYIENPEINRNFDREIELLTGKENAMGIIETIKKITREEGRKEGFISTAENLLKRGMSIREVSEITTLSVEEVSKIAERLKKDKK
jgi:predicted transposase/invertase (TIGR01784 family)